MDSVTEDQPLEQNKPQGDAQLAATIRDVADAAGVHFSTVSRALNPDTKHLVSARTVARVTKVANELGYEVNPFARGLKTTRTFTIGLVLPDITSPIFTHMARGVEDVTRKAGYSVLIADTNYSVEREAVHMAALRNRRVEGIISATGMLEEGSLKQLTDAGIELVSLSRIPDVTGILSVVSDDARGIELAVDHLVALGHTRIAHVAGPSNTSTGRARTRAFRASMAERGLDVPEKLVVETQMFVEPEGAEAMGQLFDSGADFTAVIVANDRMALGCYQTIRARGLSCPDDMSVVGFNDLPMMEYLDPPLTTVRVPHHDMGVEAAQLMLRRLSDPTMRAGTVVLPVSLQVRGSTASPSDPLR